MKATLGESLYFMFAIGVTTLALTLLVLVYQHVIRPRWHLRHVPRPWQGSSLLMGHVGTIGKGDPGETHTDWFKKLGPIVSYDGVMGSARISSTDKAALHYVLITDSYNFCKPTLLRRFLISLVGEGLLATEGSIHQRQRKIMNPSFGAPHMKSMYPLFIDKAVKLRDQLFQLMDTSKTSTTPLDIYDYATRATLDVIGSAGFGYEVDAIALGTESELYSAFHRLFSALGPSGKFELLKRIFPVLKPLLSFHKTKSEAASEHSMSVLNRIGGELIKEKKLAVSGDSSGNTQIEASQMSGRDLLSTLIRANMAVNLKPQQKMSETEVLSQIHTFMLAGNDTTANSLSWAIYALCQDTSTQSTLRAEIIASPTDSPTFDELNSLPYLDAVVRETLRLFAPIAGTSRVAQRDCVLPMAEGWVDTKGIKHNSIFVPKNTTIFIPILSLQKSTRIWGNDAEQFRPERWLEGKDKLPEGVMEMPSVAFPTFLAGPRGCIGFRFSLIEMKSMLFSLIRSFNFELAVPASEIEGRFNVVTRPRVRSKPQEGWQLPVLFSAVSTGA